MSSIFGSYQSPDNLPASSVTDRVNTDTSSKAAVIAPVAPMATPGGAVGIAPVLPVVTPGNVVDAVMNEPATNTSTDEPAANPAALTLFNPFIFTNPAQAAANNQAQAQAPSISDRFDHLHDVMLRTDDRGVIDNRVWEMIRNSYHSHGRVRIFLQSNEIGSADEVKNIMAIVRYIENTFGKRTYAHFMPRGFYRIGHIDNESDSDEVRLAWALTDRDLTLSTQYREDYFEYTSIPVEFKRIILMEKKAHPCYVIAPTMTKSGRLATVSSKPRNCWIIFRAARHAEVQAANPHLSIAEISGIIKYEWANLDPQLKALYQEAARLEVLDHAARFPKYQLRPRKTGDIRRRRTAAGRIGSIVSNHVIEPTLENGFMEFETVY